NIYNRQPVFDQWSADLSASYGNYDLRGFRAAFNVPVAADFSLRIAGATNQHNAYTQLLDNYAGLGPQYPQTQAELGDYHRALDRGQQGPEVADQSSWRVSALWHPTDHINAYISAERYRDNGTAIAELDPGLVERGIRGVVFDSPSFLHLSNDALRSRLQYHFGDGYTLSYILGLSQMKRQQIFDADNGRDGGFEQQRTYRSDFKFYSHEIHLLNSDTARLRWVAGAFSSQEKNAIVFAIDQQNTGGSRSADGASSWISDHGGAAVHYAIQPDRRVKSLGIYAQATYDLNAFSRFTLGSRYTQETKSDRGGRTLNCRVTSLLGPYSEPGSISAGSPQADQIYTDAGVSQAIANGLPYDNGGNENMGDEPCWIRQVNDFSATWSNTSGLVRVDIDIADQTMVYGSVSTGFKSGHIQDAGNTADPETVINYEVGIKSQLLNNQIRINAALYQADYKDLQFSNQDRLDTDGDGVADTGGSTVVRNASEATIRGLELELEWAITASDHLQIVGTLLDAQFKRFEIPDTLFGDLFNPYVSEPGTRSQSPVDLSGNSPPRTPDWKFTLAYEHDFSWAQWTITPRVLATFSDDYYLDIYNRNHLDAGIFPSLPNGGDGLAVQQAYETFDFSVHLVPASHQWTAQIYVKNATNEAVKIASGNFITENGFVATYMPPRTYGLSFRYLLNSD
ncbi:MAG: TonB-dependent receptor, partial [Spongiibacteraceae bacterium]|nr:TonB-dependent receptor [Spongiibacteraceae bacterium]